MVVVVVVCGTDRCHMFCVCSGLPSKSQDDIIRHQLMYDQMVEAARKKGWYILCLQSTFIYTYNFYISLITFVLIIIILVVVRTTLINSRWCGNVWNTVTEIGRKRK